MKKVNFFKKPETGIFTAIILILLGFRHLIILEFNTTLILSSMIFNLVIGTGFILFGWWIGSDSIEKLKQELK